MKLHPRWSWSWTETTRNMGKRIMVNIFVKRSSGMTTLLQDKPSKSNPYWMFLKLYLLQLGTCNQSDNRSSSTYISMTTVLIYFEQGQQHTTATNGCRSSNEKGLQPSRAWSHTTGLWWTPGLFLHYLYTGTEMINSLPVEWQRFPAPLVHSLPHQGTAQSLGISNQNANTHREQECKSSQSGSICATLRTRLWNVMEKDHESSWVRWNEIAQSWRAWAMHFVLCKLHRSLIREEKEVGEAIVLPLAFSPCCCLAADGRQKRTVQLQITLPPACICMWRCGCLTRNSLWLFARTLNR